MITSPGVYGEKYVFQSEAQCIKTLILISLNIELNFEQNSIDC